MRGAAAIFYCLCIASGRLLAADNAAVSQRDVDREIRRALGSKKIVEGLSPEARKALETETRGLLVKRQQILAYLAREKRAASEGDVDVEVERIQGDLKRRGVTLQGHLKELDATLPEFRADLAWQLSWQRLLDQEFTDEAVEKFFKANRRHYDGTSLRVSHILISPPRNATNGEIDAALKRGAAIRAEIAAGKISFADAAKRYSAAESKAAGGDIGFITRHGEQAEAFARAAFSLEKGDVSQPVRTAAGVHLIQWTEEKPGQRTLADTREEVRREAAKDLFEATAKKAAL